jgi:hypothetical protein
MRVLGRQPTTKGSAQTFDGDVWFDVDREAPESGDESIWGEHVADPETNEEAG